MAKEITKEYAEELSKDIFQKVYKNTLHIPIDQCQLAFQEESLKDKPCNLMDVMKDISDKFVLNIYDVIWSVLDRECSIIDE